MTRRGTDLPRRALDLVVRTLPVHRKEWGRAMRAELTAITEQPARRRFVRGCTRAVLISGTALRATAGYLGILAFAAAIVREAAGVASAGVRTEAGVLVAVIATLAWLGRRPGVLGPVANDPVARLIRLAGYGTAMATTAVMLTLGTNDPSGWWLGALSVGVYLAGFLRATTHPATEALSLPIAAGLAVAGLAVWWIPMLLLDGVRAVPALTFLVAFAVVAAGRALGSPQRGLLSGLAAAAAMLLLTFLAAVLTYRLAPGLAPDIAPPALGPAVRAEVDRIESIDPYVANLVLGALLTAIFTVVSALPPLPASVAEPPPTLS